MTNRCSWAEKSPELLIYHDTIWGKPVKSAAGLFRGLSLEIMQAGLTFQTILKYEEGLNEVLHYFSINYLAQLSPDDVDLICENSKVIRNHQTIAAIVHNAKMLQENPSQLVEMTWDPVHFTQLDHYLVTPLHPDDYRYFIQPYVKAFKQLGLQRIGPVTTYSFLQAVGVVNDHLLACQFRN